MSEHDGAASLVRSDALLATPICARVSANVPTATVPAGLARFLEQRLAEAVGLLQSCEGRDLGASWLEGDIKDFLKREDALYRIANSVIASTQTKEGGEA